MFFFFCEGTPPRLPTLMCQLHHIYIIFLIGELELLRFLDLVNSLSINIGTLHVTSLLLFWSVVYLVWLFEFLSCNLRSRISCLNPNLHICFAFEYQRKLFIMIKSHNVLIYRNAKHKSWTIFRVELYNLQSCSDHRVDRQLFIHNTLILWTCTFAKY